MKIKAGDIRDLPFPDNFFDGYWSLGVIEHFYNGYERIVSEMFRVLKPEGYLFLTAPVMSPLRKTKVRLKKYPEYKESKEMRENFYQFAFDPKDVINNLKNKGFKLIDVKPCDGVKGLKDEILMLKPLLQPLYDAGSFPVIALKKMLDFVLRSFANHMNLFIMCKVEVS